MEDQHVGTRDYLLDLAQDLLDANVDTFCPKGEDASEWDLEALRRELSGIFGLDGGDYAIVGFDSGKKIDDVRDELWERIERRYEDKEQMLQADLLRRIERDIMLQIVDVQWKDHLYSLDHLKEGIGLRGYGQRDPLVEYKKESYALFQAMKDRVDEEMVRYLWLLRPVGDEDSPARRPARRAAPVTTNAPSESPSLFASAPRAPAAAGRRPAPAATT